MVTKFSKILNNTKFKLTEGQKCMAFALRMLAENSIIPGAVILRAGYLSEYGFGSVLSSLETAGVIESFEDFYVFKNFNDYSVAKIQYADVVNYRKLNNDGAIDAIEAYRGLCKIQNKQYKEEDVQHVVVKNYEFSESLKYIKCSRDLRDSLKKYFILYGTELQIKQNKFPKTKRARDGFEEIVKMLEDKVVKYGRVARTFSHNELYDALEVTVSKKLHSLKNNNYLKVVLLNVVASHGGTNANNTSEGY